ncbi:MAG: hypothetical protein IT367_12555, partial [Candidatus Hydrogenedentes bacterium]|nr:hypothetical protein [Candidatus Hydrogenedentota bacterium]
MIGALILSVLAPLAAADQADHCIAMSGNGSLTIGLDINGALSVCRWPGTTAPNQISYLGADSTYRGGMWGIPIDGGVEWLPLKYGDEAHVYLPESGAPIISTIYKSIGAVATAFVCIDSDVAVFRLRFDKMPESKTVIWYSDFTPCTTVMRGLPSSELLFPGRRDMVSFTQDDTVYHCRPNAPSTAMWDDAESWLADGHEPPWFTKGDGAWIAYSTNAEFAGVACGAEQGEGAAIALAEAGSWNTQKKALGACASAVSLPIDPETRSATLYVAIGESRGDADAGLSAARQHGFQSLYDAVRTSWGERTQLGMWPIGVGDRVMELKDDAVVTLLTLTDSKTGAVARGPHSLPATCVALPRDVAWITYALDLTGHTETATKLLECYAKYVRLSDAPGAPAGTLPAQVYANGEEAASQIILDVEAPAWLLWSIWQHDAQVPEQQRAEYRKSLRKYVEAAGDFLSNWSRAVRDTPAFSYDYAQKRDVHSVTTIAIAYAGLRAAEAFMRASGEERKVWAQRSIELEDYLRFNALDSSNAFKVADPLSLWMTEIVGAGDPRWNATVQSVSEEIGANPNPQSLEKLAKLAMLLRDQNDKLSALKPVAAPTAQAALKI